MTDISSAAATAERLARGCVDVLPKGELARRIAEAEAEGRPLRVKLGMDPTSADIHLGHCVVLQKLREFQDAGHVVVLIIGDYTARVGDPSGRSKTRPVVTGEEIDQNARTYQEQAFRILDPERTELRWNGEWLAGLTPEEMFRLMRCSTVAQVLERDDFSKRMSANAPISILELMYPLLQAYDSVAIDADIEFGGTDQLFNLLMGRTVMPQYGKQPQIVMTTPILTGTDGAEKMSKSLGNYVGVAHAPEEMFGRTMSIPDELMPEWYRLASGLPWEGSEAVIEALGSGSVHPNRAKRDLASLIVERFHGAGAGVRAEQHFDGLFRAKEVPDDVASLSLADVPLNEGGKVFLPALMRAHMGVASNGEARRLIQGGGVKLDGEAVPSGQLEAEPDELVGKVLQVGKRRFLRLVGSDPSTSA
jgi:tyrosyl-tRNA synthetase